MQLVPGIFALFYHYALGKKSVKKADDLSLYFIFGTETFVAVVWFLAFFILPIIPKPLFWIIAGVLIAESLISLFFYYRKGHGTALFLPRHSAKVLEEHAKNVKTNSDAFVLGFFANTPELFFTLPLYFIAVAILTRDYFFPYAAYIIISILLTILPLFVIHILYRTDHNLAEIERSRVRLKPFVRLFLSVMFLMLAALAINLGVLSYG